jgi:hypothetical protein
MLAINLLNRYATPGHQKFTLPRRGCDWSFPGMMPTHAKERGESTRTGTNAPISRFRLRFY